MGEDRGTDRLREGLEQLSEAICEVQDRIFFGQSS